MMRIGIVGAGGMGTVHRSNYQQIDGCRVAAVVGKSAQDRERAAQWGLPHYGSVGEMAAREEIDLVDVCTPTFLHKQHVMESLALGKNTIVEKPIALCRRDAEEMFDLAERKGAQLYVAQVLQFTKETETLRDLVKSGEYGKALDASFERLTACPRWAKDGWLFDRKKSGLIPFDLHIHDLDIIVSLFGKPDAVSFTCCGGPGKGFPEQYRFCYRFGALNVAAEAAWFNAEIPFTARWRVYFENAVVISDGARVTAYQFDREPRIFDTEDRVKIPTGINVPPTGWYFSELSHFTRCARRGVPSDRVSRKQVLTVLEILEAIAAKEGEAALL